MATLKNLKSALEKLVPDTASTATLTDKQYSDGFDLFLQHGGWETYRNFIIPQLSQQLSHLLTKCDQISLLEVGPGPKSILAYLPDKLRGRISKYTAFEPNNLFAAELGEWLHLTENAPFPLSSAARVRQESFEPDTRTDERYNVILFCHSLYGMPSQQSVIKNALSLLVEEPDLGVIIIFHRDGSLRLGGLVSDRATSLPDGFLRIKDKDETLDKFAPFIAGLVLQDESVYKAVQVEWRRLCRNLARADEHHPGQLTFDSPEIMMEFTRNANALPELKANVPFVAKNLKIKNREAQSHNPAAVHGVGLTVIGGGHSGHCILPNVVAVDLSSFNQVQIANDDGREEDSKALVVAGAGCKTGDIIQATKSAGLTVPLGARPSVGAGLWLQGGIGHLARLYGLGCDAIVGAVVVSVKSGKILCVGKVPDQYQPPDATRPKDEAELLWALKGAGTNFGIVISVIFKAYPAQIFSVRDWVMPLRDDTHAFSMLRNFDTFATQLPVNSASDAYLYSDNDKLHLGLTLLRYCSSELDLEALSPMELSARRTFGHENSSKIVDGVGLFDADMYMWGMHNGHGGGKTSSFKRCVFLKDIWKTRVRDNLLAAMHSRPSKLSYFHLLHGGGAVSDVSTEATAFGCRDWDFACVVTGVWPRDQDDTLLAHANTRWVHHVVEELLPMSSGVYGADLGPDPRDKMLAAKAFGLNRRRLVNLKQVFDPYNVLPNACPLRQVPLPQRLVVLVTGEHGAGKDYCAETWASLLKANGHSSLVVRISDVTKQQYAAAKGADFNRLVSDLVESADVDVLFITGMKEEAPVASLSHKVPHVRLFDVRIEASSETRFLRRCIKNDANLPVREEGLMKQSKECQQSHNHYRPSLTFKNEAIGGEAIEKFAIRHVIPLLSGDLQKLLGMVRSVPEFPRQGIVFRHVLNINQEKGGLQLCTSLMKSIFTGDWRHVDAVVTCEAGGPVFASHLAASINVPCIAIRKGNKLPPPTISVQKHASHISSHNVKEGGKDKFEMDATAIGKGASVLIVDDVLATGETLLAALRLLAKSGVSADGISVMVIAEFPLHRGREMLRRNGFGGVAIQSLLCFDGE
ncbi:phosphoribosyl transferase domain-containing protein [Fusarium heterosporum]|uniref:Phosphoribosyl transferase domain-containing protein n=1 Tax=Fusarium heterosporum TaxID=42747 RepID=A0A8H5WEI2_FUSHE|nr:phosphoribosyl transferase domain-containing protein [Fusarium heterosporum]